MHALHDRWCMTRYPTLPLLASPLIVLASCCCQFGSWTSKVCLVWRLPYLHHPLVCRDAASLSLMPIATSSLAEAVLLNFCNRRLVRLCSTIRLQNQATMPRPEKKTVAACCHCYCCCSISLLLGWTLIAMQCETGLVIPLRPFDAQCHRSCTPSAINLGGH